MRNAGAAPVTDSPLRRLPDFGQSAWLDFIQRGFASARCTVVRTSLRGRLGERTAPFCSQTYQRSLSGGAAPTSTSVGG